MIDGCNKNTQPYDKLNGKARQRDVKSQIKKSFVCLNIFIEIKLRPSNIKNEFDSKQSSNKIESIKNIG